MTSVDTNKVEKPLVELLVSASTGATPHYMGSLEDFWVGIPEFAGDMKLIFLCFALLTHVVLLLCFCHFWVQFDLPGGHRMQCRPLDVINPSPSAISFFSTPR